jgi:flagellar biosynthesis/type III secretory pathway chaperone
MTTLEETLISLFEKKLASLNKCLQLMNEKTLVLMSNDLPRLEESLEQETLLLKELTELDSSINKLLKEAYVEGDNDPKTSLKVWVRNVDPQCRARLLTLRNRFRGTGDEIQQALRKNVALIAGGLQFTSALLEVFCPPQTYRPPGGGPQVPATAIVSVSC